MVVDLILIEISVVQPQLEGFFACLDIWTVFLDYLIGKVANARSDKLAEAEATVSRFVNQGLNATYKCLRVTSAPVVKTSVTNSNHSHTDYCTIHEQTTCID